MSVLPSHDPASDRAASLIRDLSGHKTDEPMLAEPLERLWARVIDAAAWFVAIFLLSGVASGLTALFFGERQATDELGREVPVLDPMAAWTAFILLLVTMFLYEVPSTVRSGSHFSKKRGHLLVVGPDGHAPGLCRATVRWLVFWLPLLGSLVLFGATFQTGWGLLAMLVEAAAVGCSAIAFLREDKRSLVDLVAGTRVLAAR